jgi:flagellar motor switch protein FliM
MSAGDPTNAPQVTLSQSEVEALLAAAAQEQAPESAPSVRSNPSNLKRFDVRNSTFLTVNELRKIRMRYDELLRSMTARLSIDLRLDCSIRIAELETLAYPKFVESRANPTHLALFKIENLRGTGIVEASPNLTVIFVDRLLGGPGREAQGQRELTEIDVEVFDLVIKTLLKEWCHEVMHLPDPMTSIVGHETNARYMTSDSADANFLISDLELQINECSGHLLLAVPSTMIEPMIPQLSMPTARKADQTPSLHWATRLDEVSVSVSAQWMGLELTARDLAQLKVGDIIQVDSQHAHNVSICVASRPKFVGRLGMRRQAWAVELTDLTKR